MEGGRRGCCALSSMAPTQVGVIQQLSSVKKHAAFIVHSFESLAGYYAVSPGIYKYILTFRRSVVPLSSG
jgi:hypothetical protein